MVQTNTDDDSELKAKSVSSVTTSKETNAKEDPFNTGRMRPYLSAPRKSRPTQPVHQENQRWGSYKGKTASSNDEDRKQKKGELAPCDTPIVSTVTSVIPTSQLRSEVTPPRSAPITTPEVLPSSSRGSTGRYVIPKVPRSSLKSNKLNDLVAKISPLARPPSKTKEGQRHQINKEEEVNKE